MRFVVNKPDGKCFIVKALIQDMHTEHCTLLYREHKFWASWHYLADCEGKSLIEATIQYHLGLKVLITKQT